MGHPLYKKLWFMIGCGKGLTMLDEILQLASCLGGMP
jgi:hypothetical protein